MEVTGPEIEKETPAPAPTYQEDASLAPGETKQVEFAKNGVDVNWRRLIKDSQGQSKRRIAQEQLHPLAGLLPGRSQCART